MMVGYILILSIYEIEVTLKEGDDRLNIFVKTKLITTIMGLYDT
jgi:hypothetical protein